MEFTETKELWNKILEIIKEELSPQVYNSWFSQTKVVKFEGNELIISAPGDFCKEWLEKHYAGFIQDILKRALGSDDNLIIKFKAVDQKISAPVPLNLNSEKKIKKTENFIKNNNLDLNPRYTFEYFL